MGLEQVVLTSANAYLRILSRCGGSTMSTAGHCLTDGSDAQWEVLQLLLLPPKWCRSDRGGSPWTSIAYGYFRRWRQAGVWGRIMNTLRQWERQRQGRLPEPSACCTDSQSIKTAHREGISRDNGSFACNPFTSTLS